MRCQQRPAGEGLSHKWLDLWKETVSGQGKLEAGMAVRRGSGGGIRGRSTGSFAVIFVICVPH